MTHTVWMPAGPARAVKLLELQRCVSTDFIYSHRWRDTDDTAGSSVGLGEALVDHTAPGAGQPPHTTRPLIVSAAGWSVIQPLHLTRHLPENTAWWWVLVAVWRITIKLELPVMAATWVAEQLAAQGVSSCAAAQGSAELSALTARASAAMVITAESELHRGGWASLMAAEFAETYRSLLRPNAGTQTWKGALKLLEAGTFTLPEVEPWGPMLDVSGICPPGALDKLSGPVERTLRRLARSVQGKARADHAIKPGEPSERNVAWVWQHPEVERAWQQHGAERRRQLSSTLAYQFSSAARKAAMSHAEERLHADHAEPALRGEQRGLAKSMEELSIALRPILAGQRSGGEPTDSEQRVDTVLTAWADVGQQIPHLRPALSQLGLELDPLRCLRRKVSGMALDLHEQLVYVNLGAGLEGGELRYGIAELALHLLLGHAARLGDKEPELWNLACDLLLAGWLADMGYGERPDGAPYDRELSHLPSAEAIYLRLLDLPRMRRVTTLRGQGLPDLMEDGESEARALSEDEDRAWREAAERGMEEADALAWAGTMPAGLDRELRERAAKPIPWRPALQAYLGHIVPVRSRRRTYSRLSRRTPPSPYEAKAGKGREEPGPKHSLAVIIDTSGSVGDRDLAEALGGIRTTCAVLGIDRVRILSCDAGVTDHGWSTPWNAGDKIRLKGGGGTALIPAIQLLDQLSDEPDGVHPDTPALIITDGLFDDRLSLRREHAYLMPPGTRLLFATSAPVFTIRAL